VSHELVEGIAKAGGGYAEIIRSASEGGWEDRVVAVLGAAIHGHLPPLRLDLGWDEEPSSTPQAGPQGKLVSLGIAINNPRS
jgi:hypothetical protein